jgi:hypothetical protein
VREEVCRVAVDSHAAGGAQVLFGKASAEKADGFNAGLARGLGVIGRVADDNGFGGLSAVETCERGLEDVGVGLGLLGVVGRSLFLDEVFDVRDESSSSLADDARAICLPSCRMRSKSSRTEGKAFTRGRYSRLKSSPRYFSNSSPNSPNSSFERKTGISWSPPLPI